MTRIIFTPTTPLSKLYPPTPTKKNIPDWYKNLSSYIEGADFTYGFMSGTKSSTPLSAKRCVPLMDYLVSGYTIHLPCDVLVSTFFDNGVFTQKFIVPNSNGNSFLGGHGFKQLPIKTGGLNRDYIKFFLGWKVQTPAGYSSFLYQHSLHFEDRFTLFPAIVDTDTYDGVIGSIGYFNGDKPSDFIIHAGTPLLTVFPFKRDEWVSTIEDEVVDLNDSNFITRLGAHFANAYRNFLHSKKSYD